MLGLMTALYLFPDVAHRAVAYAAIESFLNGLLEDEQFGALLLITTDQVTEILAIIGVVAAVDSGLDPRVLLLRESDGFALGCHTRPHRLKSYYWCYIAPFRSSRRCPR